MPLCGFLKVQRTVIFVELKTAKTTKVQSTVIFVELKTAKNHKGAEHRNICRTKDSKKPQRCRAP